MSKSDIERYNDVFIQNYLLQAYTGLATFEMLCVGYWVWAGKCLSRSNFSSGLRLWGLYHAASG